MDEPLTSDDAYEADARMQKRVDDLIQESRHRDEADRPGRD